MSAGVVPLTGEELGAIAAYWNGGVRDLKRYVAGVVNSRESNPSLEYFMRRARRSDSGAACRME